MRETIKVFNRLHSIIEVAGYTFPPGKEVEIQIEGNSLAFRAIRTEKGLKVAKFLTEEWKAKNTPDSRFAFNMVYDIPSQAVKVGSSYTHVVEALSEPIIPYLPEGQVGFTEKPGIGLNLRFFSETRITETGKNPVGPNDVFMSHGIGDKNYWIAPRISPFRHVLVPGPTWRDRIKKGGYPGKIWVVGYTKLDPIFNGHYLRQEREKPYVVWAPTHGYRYRHRGRSSYPWCMDLIREIPNCYDKHIALHPASRLSLHRRQDVTLQELLDADVVIADAGSTLYEAWSLGRPVIFPDWLCKNDVLAHFKDDPENLEYRIYNEGIGYHAESMEHLISLIEVALRDGMKQREIDFMEGVFPQNLRGNAGKMAARALMEIKEG
jgi:hypothetical protein